jgi:hypothetical protein
MARIWESWCLLASFFSPLIFSFHQILAVPEVASKYLKPKTRRTNCPPPLRPVSTWWRIETTWHSLAHQLSAAACDRLHDFTIYQCRASRLPGRAPHQALPDVLGLRGMLRTSPALSRRLLALKQPWANHAPMIFQACGDFTILTFQTLGTREFDPGTRACGRGWYVYVLPTFKRICLLLSFLETNNTWALKKMWWSISIILIYFSRVHLQTAWFITTASMTLTFKPSAGMAHMTRPLS